MWTHLERQRGGIGLRGPGETQIETDRRIILDKISRLKNQLKKIDKQKATQRKNRGNKPAPQYTPKHPVSLLLLKTTKTLKKQKK